MQRCHQLKKKEAALYTLSSLQNISLYTHDLQDTPLKGKKMIYNTNICYFFVFKNSKKTKEHISLKYVKHTYTCFIYRKSLLKDNQAPMTGSVWREGLYTFWYFSILVPHAFTLQSFFKKIQLTFFKRETEIERFFDQD